jgi:membrane protein implicated in regulation of membrane protease activity
MPVALIWLIAALALAGAEALTGDLFLLMLGGGALAAAGSSLVFDDLWVQGAVFLVVSILMLAANDDDVYEPGDHVTVVHIDGATAVVQKVV